jgi:hypothetical protein
MSRQYSLVSHVEMACDDCPYSHFVHFLVIPVMTVACMFVPLIDLMIFCHRIQGQQFATQSMGSRGNSMNTTTVDVAVPSGLMFAIQLMVKNMPC